MVTKEEKKRRRILIIVGTLRLGGIERMVTNLAISLKKTGVWEPNVCCIIARDGPFIQDLEGAGIPVYECRIKRNHVLDFIRDLTRLVRSINPDLVHSQVDFSIPWQIIGFRLGGVKKIIFTQHNDYQYWKNHLWARLRIILYFWICWPFISAYTTVSKNVRSSLASLALRNESDFQVIYNPVDVNTFVNNPIVRENARRLFGVSSTDYVIGSVARFSEQKGHIYLVQAVANLTHSIPDLRIVFIGEGPLVNQIKDQVIKSGLDNHFIFLGQRRDSHLLYAGMDCFVLPSLWEGFGIVIIEAMAACLPIVASKVGGIIEALGEEDTGSLVPPANSKKLAEAILSYYSNPSLAISTGQKARKRVIELFSMETIVSQYIQLYLNI